MDLTDVWDYLIEVAVARLQTNRTKNHVSDFGERIELLGTAGEYVARSYFSLPLRLHGTFDRGRDFFYAGYSIDVKTTQLTNNLTRRFLQIPKGRSLRSDIYLLTAVSLTDKHGAVIGYAWRSEVERSKINEDREYPCHEIHVNKLHQPWRLLEKTAKRQQTYKKYHRLPRTNSSP